MATKSKSKPKTKPKSAPRRKKSALGGQRLMAFAATSNPAKARAFYRDALGLKLISDDGFALAFDAGGVMLRVQVVEKVAAAPYTVLGWDVPDITASIKALRASGVRFVRYTGMDQNKLGVWLAPSGAKIAWFTDPDGNTLSLAEI
jgi:catechol 2,3-dioxygenase-like lactoylglutathione lyase family enzyme